MAGEGTEGAGGEGTGTQTAAQAPPAKTGGGGAGESALLDKIERLNTDLSQERAKVKTLEKERNDFRSKATDLEVKDKKRGALDKALGSIGEDFQIDEARRTKLQNNVAGLSDGPDLESLIADMVDLAKQPKAADNLTTPFTRPNNGSGGNDGVPEKKASEYTTEELAVISRQEPERYKEIRQQRSNLLTFGQAKG